MKSSLRSKFIVILFFLLIFVTISASIISSFELKRYYKSILLKNMETQLRELDFLFLNTHFGVNSAGIDDDQLKRYAKTARLRLTLIDSSGAVIFDSRVAPDSLQHVQNHLLRSEIVEAARDGIGNNERLSATVDEALLYAALRVDARPSNPPLNHLKYIRLAIPLTEFQRVVRELRFKIFIGGGIALLVMLAISYWISNRFTSPITQLMRAAESVKAGKLDVHFKKVSRDEIGLLADLLNEMLDKLRNDLIELRKLEQVRSQFLGNVSHELRTPIFAVQGYLETLMNNQNCDADTRAAFIAKAYHQAVRLNDLLRDLIDISRMESGEMKMSFTIFSLHDWIEKLVADYQPSAQENNIALNFLNAGDDRGIKINSDQERLNQVMGNLIINAIKYNRQDGRVDVGYTEKENAVTLFVADIGRGIAAEHVPRIFERFYRVDKERSRAAGGTGLGLAIVKHIVEAHKSRIFVESTVGQGSRFHFDLQKARVRA